MSLTGVIVGDAVDEGEIVAGQPRLQHRRQVGVVGQESINLGIERTRRIAWHVRRVEIDQPPIVRAGLEHQAAAVAAARLHVDDDADARPPCRIADQRIGAQQAIFLAIGEHRLDGMAADDTPRLHGADGFQDGGDARTVIARPGTGGHRIQMRHHHDGFSLAGRDLGDQVGDAGTVYRAPAQTAVATEAAERGGL